MTLVSEAQSGWPQIGDILNNHAAGRPDPSGDLAGRRLTLTLGDGATVSLVFRDAAQLSWRDSRGRSHDAQPYQAFDVRGGRYFVDFIHAGDELHSISLWLDPARQAALLVEGFVANRELDASNLLTRVEKTGAQSVPTMTYSAASLDGGPAPFFGLTDKLFGKYLRYVYSDTHVYDHYYVNPKYYFWYCWHGPDAGIGEFDEAEVFELADDIYLVGWREKFLPCLAVTIEDHGAMVSIGKVFGADSHSWRTANSTVGATMSLVTDIPVPAAPPSASKPG